MERKKWKNKNFLGALKNSLHGIKYTLKNERNLKIQLTFAFLAIVAGAILKLTPIKWCILFITIGFVIFAELINTAIEVMLDLYSQEYNENIKQIKDIASGAVLLTAVISVLVGIMLFVPEIIKLI